MSSNEKKTGRTKSRVCICRIIACSRGGPTEWCICRCECIEGVFMES